MSTTINVTEEVENIVKDIIIKHNFDPNSKIQYREGSEIGDGYMSKTASVDITNGKESLSLFVKYSLGVSMGSLSMDKIYANEVHFYDVIFPAYTKFVKSKGIEESFKYAPRCYGTSSKNVIALENLKKKDFELFSARLTMNKDHIVAVLKAFAKYHSISLAFKDQDNAGYQKFIDGTVDVFAEGRTMTVLDNLMRKSFNELPTYLDPVVDKKILDECDRILDNVSDYVTDYIKHSGNFVDTYSIITKGDCWSNNIMFRYEEEDKSKPVDVLLVDWQAIRVSSLVADISYVFYTVAAKEEMNRLAYYMKIYHEELSKNIKQLGSDPGSIYPYSIFESEWKLHSKYGLFFAVIILNSLLTYKDDQVALKQLQEGKKTVMEVLEEKKFVPAYFDRLKNLIEHFIENEFI